MNTHHDFFISHSSEDAESAERLVELLEGYGLTCWYAPRDIPLGQDFAAAIFQALELCGDLVVLVSESSNKSEHVAREVGIAAQMGKSVVPVILNDTTATGALCYYSRTAMNIQDLSVTSPKQAEAHLKTFRKLAELRRGRPGT